MPGHFHIEVSFSVELPSYRNVPYKVRKLCNTTLEDLGFLNGAKLCNMQTKQKYQFYLPFQHIFLSLLKFKSKVQQKSVSEQNCCEVFTEVKRKPCHWLRVVPGIGIVFLCIFARLVLYNVLKTQ